MYRLPGQARPEKKGLQKGIDQAKVTKKFVGHA